MILGKLKSLFSLPDTLPILFSTTISPSWNPFPLSDVWHEQGLADTWVSQLQGSNSQQCAFWTELIGLMVWLLIHIQNFGVTGPENLKRHAL